MTGRGSYWPYRRTRSLGYESGGTGRTASHEYHRRRLNLGGDDLRVSPGPVRVERSRDVLVTDLVTLQAGDRRVAITVRKRGYGGLEQDAPPTEHQPLREPQLGRLSRPAGPRLWPGATRCSEMHSLTGRYPRELHARCTPDRFKPCSSPGLPRSSLPASDGLA
jgi:hypothetical protein